MNKTAIKNFAIWSRVTLIDAVKQKAFEYDITEQGGEASAVAVGGRLLTEAEKKQRAALISQIAQKGYAQVMEEAAYTWFNRFIALRYMEVNNFLPLKIRLFSDENDEFNPEILKEAMNVELDGIDKNTIFDLIEKQDNEKLYKYLLIAQCNALGECLPGMFEKIEDYTELLFPNNLLKLGSVLDKMVTEIPTEDWEDIEIIGWMYQYYISEKHEEVVDPLHGKIVKKEDIPAATQLFTTKWVVQYVVDNSLGRYWIERHPESNLADSLEFFVKSKKGEMKYVDEQINPEDIKVLDPCCGSAHFLVYAFEVLMLIYAECGWSERDAAKSILENNLFGLDIDDRAGQLAYFAVMMKARKYNRRILNGGTKPNVMAIQESNNLNSDYLSLFGELKDKALVLMENMKDAKELGSIIQVKLTVEDLSALKEKAEEIKNYFYDNFFDTAKQAGVVTDFIPLINQATILAQKYEIVVTNPPFLNKFDPTLKKFINDNYADYKSDLFSVFIYRNFGFCKKDGYSGFMSPFVWMFIKSYEVLRKYIIRSKSFVSLVQMEYSAFEEATVPVCSFILKNGKETYKGLYFKLSDFKGGMEVQKKKVLEALADENCKYFFETTEENFSKIPGSPIAYWVSERFIEIFANELIYSLSSSPSQNITGNNEKYVRKFWELSSSKIGHKDMWIFYAKGGGYRKWWGNLTDVVNWTPSARYIYQNGDGKHASQIINKEFWYKKAITWGLITSSAPSFRVMPKGATFDKGGSSVIIKDDYFSYIIALLNSKLFNLVSSLLNPTLNYQVKDICSMPVIIEKKEYIDNISNECVSLSKLDWDSFETSWDFKKHPLI